MITKIVQIVNSCRECPNRHYDSGGIYECMKVQPSKLNEDMSIPLWCPLAGYETEAWPPDMRGAFKLLQDSMRSLPPSHPLRPKIAAFLAEPYAPPENPVATLRVFDVPNEGGQDFHYELHPTAAAAALPTGYYELFLKAKP